jgi:hypothetical protein
MRFLVAIDDTDNLESRGTGYLARRLAGELEAAGLARPIGVTRHQLLVDPRIPYTSHNSAACIEVDADTTAVAGLEEFGRGFLKQESAEGSDAGLCIIAADQVSPAVRAFGARAKVDVLDMDQARQVAAAGGHILHGLTGTGGGMIGALAAVGLRAEGNDGRFLWLPGLRELTGVLPVGELMSTARIDVIRTVAGDLAPAGSTVEVGDWPRPLVRDGQAVLLVEEAGSGASDWVVVGRDVVKAASG